MEKFMNENRQLAISTNPQMSQQLISMNEQFERAARQNVQAFLENASDNGSFTITEKRALVKLEQLKLIGDLTLAEILLRGQVIAEIEAQGLWNTHPMGYSSMEEAAAAQGISQSEYSNIRDLNETIFPYLAQQNYNIADLWESIGKSKFRELIPILKRAITGEESRSQRVEAIFENKLNDIYASAQTNGEQVTEDEARTILIDQLVEAGQLPVRELRQRMRPERRPTLQGYRLPFQENRTILMVVLDPNQQEMINRRLDGYIEIRQVTQDDILRSPQIRQLGQFLLHGD
jgi:hypothetical protein